jgi:hypothetical protein
LCIPTFSSDAPSAISVSSDTGRVSVNKESLLNKQDYTVYVDILSSTFSADSIPFGVEIEKCVITPKYQQPFNYAIGRPGLLFETIEDMFTITKTTSTKAFDLCGTDKITRVVSSDPYLTIQ